MESTSIWTLKKKPMNEIASYIMHHSDINQQARLVKLTVQEYRLLSQEAAADQLILCISKMEDGAYTDFLLELIDE